jgi:hypothetical protein
VDFTEACARVVTALKEKRPKRPEDIPGFEIRRASVDDVSAVAVQLCRCSVGTNLWQGCVAQLKWMLELTLREGWNKCPQDLLAIHTVDREHSFVGTVFGHRVVSASGHVYQGSNPLFGHMYYTRYRE